MSPLSGAQENKVVTQDDPPPVLKHDNSLNDVDSFSKTKIPQQNRQQALGRMRLLWRLLAVVVSIIGGGVAFVVCLQMQASERQRLSEDFERERHILVNNVKVRCRPATAGQEEG